MDLVYDIHYDDITYTRDFIMQILNCYFFFYFYFFINNIRILLIKEKVPNRVHWGCTIGAQIRKQKYNDQEK